jgi:crotonobetainyl-CoA:carnitine CoA-transferase CaiB-like acyl-CoA transferase
MGSQWPAANWAWHPEPVSKPTPPLAGVLVVSLEQAVAAPLASYRLAEAGARVVKVERPEGDMARGYDRAANGISSYFAWINRGKESVALDLRDRVDRDVMEGLLDRADVFIQNLAVGATDRLGYGASTLRARRPELIVCDISGYGPDGPYATMKAYDLLVQAESGLLSVSGPPGPYGRIGVSVADIGTGTTAALAISQAIVRRERTGEGAHIETSLFETMADWMTVPLLHHDYLDRPPERVGLAHPSIAPYGGFASADGDVVLISIQSDREWGTLCREVLDRPDLAEDPTLATNVDRVANRDRTDGVVAEVFAGLGTERLRERLAEARIAFAMVNDVAGLSHHPQLHRTTASHEVGEVALPAPPVRTDWTEPASVPALDEHGPAIRAEFGSA